MTTIIMLIIFLVILIFISIIGILIFLLKNFTKIVIFMPDGHIYSKKYFKIITSDFINTSIGMYKIDYKKAFRTKTGYTLYYVFNNPEPLNIDINNKKVIIGYNSIDIKNFYESDLIQKLFKTENLEKLILILIIIILILSLINVIYPFIQKPSPVDLKNSLNNTEIIKNACIQAIKGI